MEPRGPSVCPAQEWEGRGRRGHPHPREAHHTATATIFMTHSLRHWQKLTRGAPLSPMRPNMMPVGAGIREWVAGCIGQGQGVCDAYTCRRLGQAGTDPQAHMTLALG